MNMLNVILKTLLLCLFSNTLFGQNNSIRVAGFDTSVSQIAQSQIRVDSFTFTIDSIQVEGVKYENTIVTKSIFKENKTILHTTYYLKEGKMNFVKVIEPMKGPGKLYRYCDFYFTNSILVAQNCRSIRQLGVAIRADGKDVSIGYNENLTFNFLKTYVSILFTRLQNYR